ncbi:MAG: type II toxin-antitoxin system PemK/MazF family toxin [Bacteroidales bacterium]|nr:type II toxin-antitoxin system PemK/MazF family toxin [Bacteroidales bacterium]MCF8336945.1 type II toxin-antitoxin system PemK/MazF family toxin [Bacteroidales bacterium]
MKYKKWSILRANLDPVIGSEQGKSRPVLVIGESDINQLLNTINIIPLTSRKNNRNIYPNEVLLPPEKEYGIDNESIILCHQIRTLDKRRLSNYYGEIYSDAKRYEIMEALRFQLGIDQY